MPAPIELLKTKLPPGKARQLEEAMIADYVGNNLQNGISIGAWIVPRVALTFRVSNVAPELGYTAEGEVAIELMSWPAEAEPDQKPLFSTSRRAYIRLSVDEVSVLAGAGEFLKELQSAMVEKAKLSLQQPEVPGEVIPPTTLPGGVGGGDPNQPATTLPGLVPGAKPTKPGDPTAPETLPGQVTQPVETLPGDVVEPTTKPAAKPQNPVTLPGQNLKQPRKG